MRLLLVNYEYPPLGGGAGQATAQLAREWAAAGHEPVVLTSRFRGQPRSECVEGVRIERVPVVRRRADRCTPPEMLTFIASASIFALQKTKAWRPDFTIAFFGIPSGPVALLLKWRRGIPYLVSLRGGDVPGFQPYDLALFHKLLGPAVRLIWKKSRAVVANSTGLRELGGRFAPDLKIHTIPNGVDIEQFSPREKIAGTRVPRLLFVGRLVFQKGLDVLWQALASLPRDLDFTLKIAGDGPERDSLEASAKRLGLAGKIEFAGWCAREKIAELYRDADIFVLPSRDEGMPNVVLEAMACGLPVVATKIAGSEELVRPGVNGTLVPVDDASALAGALRDLLKNPEQRHEMGAASRAIVEREYSWRRVAREYLKLIEELR